MRKSILTLLLLLTLSSNKAYEQIIILNLDQSIINDLKLIKNTYNWVGEDKIKSEMIRRQNKIVYNDELQLLYKDYLIHEEWEGLGEEYNLVNPSLENY